MMNKLKTIFFTLILLIVGYTTIHAADTALYLDGKLLNTDVPPIIVQNRSFVPVRSIFEKMGAEVTWIKSRQQVIIRSSDTRIVLNVDSTTAYVDDETAEMDVAPFIKDGRTMVPVRFISENLKYDVKWENNSVYISTKKNSVSSKTPKINKININEKDSSTEVVVNIANMEKPSISYADSPVRFIADFPNTTMSLTGSKMEADTKDVTEVRYAIHPEHTRIVIESPCEVTYTVKYTSSAMIINVKSKNTSDEEDITTEEPAPVVDGDTLVVIDAGHGGKDCGAIGYDSEGEPVLYESEVNLAIAESVYNALSSGGVNAVMTRTKDVALGDTEMDDLLERSSIANEMGATFFVSIHCNSFTEPTAGGTEILYADTEDKIYSGVTSKELAQNVLTPLLKATGLTDRGLKDSPKIVVLRTTTMPSILVETAFISNPQDMEILADEDKLIEIGEAIAEGIVKSLGMLEQ